MTQTKNKIVASFVASLMMVSMIAMAFAPAGVVSTSGPEGMLAIGDAQIDEDLPEDTDAPIRAADLEGAIYASDHADTLEAIVTTPERAEEEYLDAGTIVTNDEVALVLRDDEVHDGREVAVELALLETAVGFAPDVAYGVHESGEEWQSPIDKDGEVGVFEVPEFSDNTVTFSGGISLSGSEASDGTSYQYELDSLDGLDNFEISVTGVENTDIDSHSTTTSGSSYTVDVGGTTDPRNEELTIEGVSVGGAEKYNADSVVGGIDYVAATDSGWSVVADGSQLARVDADGTVAWEKPDENPAGVAVTPDESTVVETDGDGYLRTYDPDGTMIDEWQITGSTASNGLAVAASNSMAFMTEQSGPVHAITLADGSTEWTADVGTNAFEIVHDDDAGEVLVLNQNGVLYVFDDSTGDEIDQYDVSSSDDDLVVQNADTVLVASDGDVIEVDRSTGSTSTLFSSIGAESLAVESGLIHVGDDSGEITAYDDSLIEEWSASVGSGVTAIGSAENAVYAGQSDGSLTGYSTGPGPAKDVEISVNGEVVFSTPELEYGQIETATVTLANGSNDVSVSVSEGEVVTTTEWTEVTEAVDPTVVVNGYTTEHDGVLTDGETVDLASNTGWLQDGENVVEVRTSSPETGPESLVGFEYSHDASSVTAASSVEATTWSETTTANNTFPSAVEDATVTVPVHDRVTDIRELTVEVDGEETTADYSLDGTDVTIDLGDVDAGTEVSVEVVGAKVQVYDGEIEVLEPTVEGDSLSTEVEISELTEDGMFGIQVDGTEIGDRVHYASDRSWSGDNAYAEVTSSGTQILRADEANEGSTMTVSSAPISVEPESGAMEVEVDDGTEPRFSLREGDTVGASTVDVTYHDTLSGERYVLWSESEDREIDADRASSPVFFTTDGSAETYTIRQLDREGSASAGAPVESGSTAPLVLVLPAVAISVSGLFWAGRRFGGARGVRGNAILLVGSTIVSAAALELVTPGSLIADIWRASVFALGDAAAGGIGAVLAAIATLVGMWQLNERTERDVPAWVLVPAVSLSAVLALEAIRPGSVLGVLEEVILEVGALLLLLSVGVAIWRWRQRDQADQTPDTELTFELEDD